MIKLLVCTSLLFVSTQGQDYRLPDYVKPKIYQLIFDIDPEKDNFTASATISFVTSKNTSEIFLHVSPQYININNVIANQLPCIVKDINNVTEIAHIICPLNFTKDIKSSIVIYYQGFYSDDYCGIFKNYYKENGNVHTLVATQMQPICARRVFPCFDEPQLKSRFDVSIYHPLIYDARGNQARNRRINVTNPNMKVESFFETTPSMSTYLLGFVVSKLYIFKANGTNVQSKKTRNSIGIALDHGGPLLRSMGKYTNWRYTETGINKITHIALPALPAEAMENWGMCTYGEVYILDEGNDTTIEHKQMIIQMMAHEIVHQWFGNLVTMDWWSNLWLNEGFARFFEYYIAAELKNVDLELEKQFVVKNIHPTLLLDSFPNDPLSNDCEEIETAERIDEKFNEISYGKGASVIRMIRGIMGKENFQRGLHFYLISNKFANSNPNILFESLQLAHHIDAHSLYITMHSFVYKSGYPLLNVRMNESNRIQITQEEFGIVTNPKKDNSFWYVPISYTTSREKQFDGEMKFYWLEPEKPFYLYVEEDAWIVVNLQQIGYFRVNYDTVLWDRIIKALKEPDMSSIDVLNRAALIDDIFNIARVGRISYRKAFDLAEYLKNETEYYPWVAYFNNLFFMMEHLSDDKTAELLEGVSLQWLKQAFPAINLEEDGVPISTVKHVEILKNKCFLGDQTCLEYVFKSYADFKTTLSLENYNERYLILCTAISLSDNQSGEFDFLFDLYQNTDSAYVRRTILKALGCASETLERYWHELQHENSSILPQDFGYVIDTIIESGNIGVDLVLNTLESNLTDFDKRFSAFFPIQQVISQVAGKINNDEELTKLKSIVGMHQDIIGTDQGALAIRTVETNLAWATTHDKEIQMALKLLYKNSSNRTKVFYHIIIANLLILLLVKLL